jgi:hypothetical protein
MGNGLCGCNNVPDGRRDHGRDSERNAAGSFRGRGGDRRDPDGRRNPVRLPAGAALQLRPLLVAGTLPLEGRTPLGAPAPSSPVAPAPLSSLVIRRPHLRLKSADKSIVRRLYAAFGKEFN